jgi:hypothetical protein
VNLWESERNKQLCRHNYSIINIFVKITVSYFPIHHYHRLHILRKNICTLKSHHSTGIPRYMWFQKIQFHFNLLT